MSTKATKTPRAALPKTTNGNGQSTQTNSTRKRGELTLDEMSLRAYKMTYERLHGEGKKAATKKAKSTHGVTKPPRVA